MRFGQRHGPHGPVPFVEQHGVRLDFGVFPSIAHLASVDALIVRWRAVRDSLAGEVEAAIHAGLGVPIDESVPLLAPIARPSKVFGVGFNYPDHAREFGTVMSDRPNIFSIASSSLVGHGEPVLLDKDLSVEIDWEAELAVVIGDRLSKVGVADALAGVFGYTICNDITARDLQRSESQWTRAKGFDGSHPLGPVIVTTDEIPNPQSLSLSLTVNGEIMQKGATSDMFFSVAEIIAFLSEAITLEPGDVIATGTTPGVGAFRVPPVFLTPGDVVAVELASVGRLVNPCVAMERRS